jgi:hypothetical protein
MSRRTKFLITALFLVLLAIPVAYVAYTWEPANPLRVRVLRIDTPSVHSGEPSHRMVHLEMRNSSSAATIRLGYAGVFHKSGNAFIVTSLDEFIVSPEELVEFGGALLASSHKKEVVIPPQGSFLVRAHLPLSEAETGPLEDCTVAYGYSSTTRFRILRFYRGMADLLPLSWRKHIFPDPGSGHLPEVEFHEARTSLEPAP